MAATLPTELQELVFDNLLKPDDSPTRLRYNSYGYEVPPGRPSGGFHPHASLENFNASILSLFLPKASTPSLHTLRCIGNSSRAHEALRPYSLDDLEDYRAGLMNATPHEIIQHLPSL